LSLKYSSEEEKFIPAARLGMLVKILENKLKIAVDTEKYFNDSQFLVYGGAEYSLGDMFFVRAGANTTGEIGAGAGFSFQDIVFDYGAGISEAMVSHKFALSYRFGGYELALKAEPDVFSPIGGNRKTYIRITARHKYSIYKWRLDITDGMGEIVKSWTGSGDPDSVEIWDGLRSDGMPMKEGEYRAVLKVTDENDVSSFSAPIKIKISNTDTFNIPLMGD
ncbi:MAG TPA: hypothetical protein P5511_02605, partial [Candidatus Goldiibacteriota bacterium]|nr:hypothetical protein [Candidatus Goldiibacteriota bacterium]